MSTDNSLTDMLICLVLIVRVLKGTEENVAIKRKYVQSLLKWLNTVTLCVLKGKRFAERGSRPLQV